ncbi:MAG: hypothetical protein A2X05_09965 [Bacteroidetes bacterium GWE2_41_25]|nr:MAG: hypothetical protein A2X03_07735 [Bacteroidetes bacterium GWA2_40_15]OFX92828.1 MAG: hypothetical protein A2X05_09965 [Bacteroidetes bacterium GWE2_41_25]OFY56984.1 MAG: hypothetical protein A2X04_04095 [Bacteroidetes bacterium GWF2_41_9]HAM11709.1 hypothetical protein [Bacteroidales bacterium]HBH84692.1 hypothetical protein [Bacteroidales bacterium]
MKSTKIVTITLLWVFVLFLITGADLSAIPAFARKYSISCQVCHAPAMPRLKAFGEDFAGDGFRLTDYESPRHFLPVGDDRLSLFRELPLAIRFDGFASYNFNDEGQADFSTPFVLKIMSGGELSDKLSYYFYFLLSERGEIAGIEDAFLMYRDLFSTGINFYIGQFQTSDPLFKGELRYTLEPYRIYGASPGNSTTDLKYDRGIVLEKGFSTGTDIVGQVVNGCGLGEADEGYLFDKDKYKNFMGKITQSIGKNLSIGFFGYTGRELLSDPGMFYTDITNELTMFGPDIALNLSDKFILNMQYLWRKDSQVFSNSGDYLSDIDTEGGFAEIIFSPAGDKSKWYLTGLANLVNSNIDELDYTSATLHAGYLIRRNVRLVTEYTQVIEPVSYGKVSAGFSSAF